jgi:hypothetical protein
MGTQRTARNRIAMLRETFRTVGERGQSVSRTKLEAQIVLTGSTKRHARETIQIFIDAEEVLCKEVNGEQILTPNPTFYPKEELPEALQKDG